MIRVRGAALRYQTAIRGWDQQRLAHASGSAKPRCRERWPAAWCTTQRSCAWQLHFAESGDCHVRQSDSDVGGQTPCQAMPSAGP